MKPVCDVGAIRQHAILASLAGFPFLLVFGIVWITAGVLSYLVPRDVVGAHFLPFDWIYQTTLYRILGVVVSVAPFVVLIFVRERALHYTGFVVGAALLAGAFVARAHARATWRSTRGNEATRGTRGT